MVLLSNVVDDDQIDLETVSWHLATEAPGAKQLGEAAQSLSSHQRIRLLRALAHAGADDVLLREFMEGARHRVDLTRSDDIDERPQKFRFAVAPADANAARRAPELCA
jgi:hypothetical protein